jgi:hypothetical protein
MHGEPTMTDLVVYRSTHSDVLAHWQATASAEAQNAWREKVEAVLAELGFPGRRFATSGNTDRKVIGVEHPHGEEVPEGWRRSRELPEAIVPARRTSVGKRIGKQLDKLILPNPRKGMPGGMPHIAFAAKVPQFLQPGVARRGDAVYVTWSGELDEGDAAHIDPGFWERVKLSEYYAVLEAEKDTKAGAKS